MSDNVEELAKRYEEDVRTEHYPRSIGLFTIPEYPELESRGMWSAALDAILTTLRYLAPATLLTLFWGQQGFLFTLLKHIDNAFRTIVFSSEAQKQEVLKWLGEVGLVQVEHLDTVWRNGWILCGVLDASLPGACAGHPPTMLSLKHAQTMADHYLGVEPVFSRQELESNDSLSRQQEWKLVTYLERVREALSKITPPVSKPSSKRTSPETTQFTIDYVAKGTGLLVAQVHHKMSFKIYPTAQQAMEPGEVTILIRGPKDTYGMTVLPPIFGKAQKIRQKLLGLQSKQTVTENALPITQGATYLRAYGKNDINKTYYIPKTKYDIDIEIQNREDHVKVCYTLTLEGKYEVSITSRGQNIVGSPFAVTASRNIFGLLEKENCSLEDGEEIDIIDVKTDRKVVLRIVDFVTEKMLLRENGSLEAISENEAKMLMSTDVENERSSSTDVSSKTSKIKFTKFNNIAHKVLKMNRVCKVFNDIIKKKKHNEMPLQKTKSIVRCTRKQKDIPDIVNSTLSDTHSNPFVLSEKRNKYIVPESISVSIRTEKAQPFNEDVVRNPIIKVENIALSMDADSTSCSPDSLEKIHEEEQSEDENISVDRMTPLSSNNPFLTDVFENFAVEKKLGTFVKSEYETNSSQCEETRDFSIKIIVDTNDSPSQIINTFFDTDVTKLERPKTPVYKIITGDTSNRADSPFLDPRNELISEDMLSNKFDNPFLMHQFPSNQHHEQPPVTDFIIGAPVSLPPMVRAVTPEPDIEPRITTKRKLDITSDTKKDGKLKEEDEPLSVFSTPEYKSQLKPKEAISSTFHSLDSSLTDTIDISTASTSSENQYEPYKMEITHSSRDLSPKKDLWDSAYVSIDDANSSPDNNNNENTTTSEPLSKHKFSPSDKKSEDMSDMGPAERELWQTCVELHETNKLNEEHKSYRWEIKRPMFTPIIEESDRSISLGVKETSLKTNETDSVTMAFAGLNDMYQEYFPYSENSSTTALEDNEQQSIKVERPIEKDDTGVESASEALSDVMRHKEEREGMISEVQANVTESVSVSQPLHDNIREQSHEFPSQNNDETQFGDKKLSNLVLEKKKYWDEKIRQIEAQSEETTKQYKRKRIYAKQLKHDSLSKRKGRQIVKNFLNANNEEQAKLITQVSINKPEFVVQESVLEENKSDLKLVEKWKKYWDEKLESENEDEHRSKSPSTPSKSTQQNKSEHVLGANERNEKSKLTIPVKQELPEEVFKAFETSPKRFFGTSRKRILNKIDTFVGKPSSIVDDSPTDLSEECPDSGLVSSRIYLFHSMSNTEPLPCMKRKCQSLHNIHQRKDSEKSIASIEGSAIEHRNTQTSTESSLEYNSGIISIADKRARLAQTSFNTSFDETDIPKPNENKQPHRHKTIKEFTKPTHIDKYKKNNVLRKTSISKSEMDIFSKVPIEESDGLDKYKSCDELPKINVKSFISLYENVSKTSDDPKPVKRIYRPSSVDSQKPWQSISVTSDAEEKPGTSSSFERRTISKSVTPEITPSHYSRSSKISESTSIESLDLKTDNESLDTDVRSVSKNKETTYVSLSDIELEIVESCPDKSSECSPERTEPAHIEYKNRFKKAKQFFKSLEELREVKATRKLNECEILLLNKSSESLENDRPKKRIKKLKKSYSMPSSELAKYWNQMQESEKQDSQNESTTLVKISEKFHVDDLFSDVMESKLSRQGSLRGIPHKKAVLEAFRSMENISGGKMSPYEFTTSKLSDFAQDNNSKNAPTYLSEYPYLPTTDPSKSHSRLDAKASGLITLKELLEKKGRRNSVPDLRLNPTFSADL